MTFLAEQSIVELMTWVAIGDSFFTFGLLIKIVTFFGILPKLGLVQFVMLNKKTPIFVCFLTKTGTKIGVFCGTLDAIRTRGLPLRRRTLYPAELRGHMR